MAMPPNKDKAARKAGRKEAGPRQRLMYLRARTAELKAELAKLTEERKSLQALVKTERKAKPEGAV